MKALTVLQAAARLDVTPQRIRAMITSGKLVAFRPGRDWIITEHAMRSLEAQRQKKRGEQGK